FFCYAQFNRNAIDVFQICCLRYFNIRFSHVSLDWF
ncbi:MAG: hypothetical protein ACI8XB_000948, partial [Patiriisocius sp.]